MVFTGANKPADAEITGAAVAVASAMAVAVAPTAITKLVMKTGLEGSKKNSTQNYVNRLWRDYNKTRQESL